MRKPLADPLKFGTSVHNGRETKPDKPKDWLPFTYDQSILPAAKK
jgi:hypothetical protein